MSSRRQTFLDGVPPALGPVAQLQSVTLLNLGSLLETAYQLVTQSVAVVNALHRALVVPWLRTHHKHQNIPLNMRSHEAHSGLFTLSVP